MFSKTINIMLFMRVSSAGVIRYLPVMHCSATRCLFTLYRFLEEAWPLGTSRDKAGRRIVGSLLVVNSPLL